MWCLQQDLESCSAVPCNSDYRPCWCCTAVLESLMVSSAMQLRVGLTTQYRCTEVLYLWGLAPVDTNQLQADATRACTTNAAGPLHVGSCCCHNDTSTHKSPATLIRTCCITICSRYTITHEVASPQGGTEGTAPAVSLPQTHLAQGSCTPISANKCLSPAPPRPDHGPVQSDSAWGRPHCRW